MRDNSLLKQKRIKKPKLNICTHLVQSETKGRRRRNDKSSRSLNACLEGRQVEIEAIPSIYITATWAAGVVVVCVLPVSWIPSPMQKIIGIINKTSFFYIK